MRSGVWNVGRPTDFALRPVNRGALLLARGRASFSADVKDRGRKGRCRQSQSQSCLQCTNARPASINIGAAAALFLEELLPVLHARISAQSSRGRQDQPATAVWVQTAAVVYSLARAAKSSASLACQVRAVSVTARCAAIRSSTARRR